MSAIFPSPTSHRFFVSLALLVALVILVYPTAAPFLKGRSGASRTTWYVSDEDVLANGAYCHENRFDIISRFIFAKLGGTQPPDVFDQKCVDLMMKRGLWFNPKTWNNLTPDIILADPRLSFENIPRDLIGFDEDVFMVIAFSVFMEGLSSGKPDFMMIAMPVFLPLIDERIKEPIGAMTDTGIEVARKIWKETVVPAAKELKSDSSFPSRNRGLRAAFNLQVDQTLAK